MIHHVSLIAATLLFSSPVLAADWVRGTVTHVRDVDTIEVQGVPIRLNGLDGPELKTKSGIAGKTWMQDLVLRKRVECQLNGSTTGDRYVGICYLPSGEDIGAMAVASGMARDCPRYSNGRYRPFETNRSRALPQSSYCRK